MNCQKLIASFTRMILLLSLLGSVINVPAQQPSAAEETKQGIQLYQQGNNKEAIEALRDSTKKNKSDAEAWHYLGLVLLQDGKDKDARKAFEASLKLRSDNVAAQIGIICVLLRSDRSADAIRKVRQTGRNAGFRNFSETADELEKFFRLSPKQSARSAEDWRERLEMLKLYANCADKANPARTVFEMDEVTVKPVITFKEPVRYTDQAREHETQGVVVIKGILSETGRIIYPLVVRSLPDGLTEAALNVLARMRWKPAERNGKPVAVIFPDIDFTFNIH